MAQKYYNQFCVLARLNESRFSDGIFESSGNKDVEMVHYVVDY
jgi:hypothetical protein